MVASDDPRVHTAVRGFSWVESTVFIERIESYYSAAPTVLAALRAVNAWLSDLATPDSLPADLLHWTHHVEGGDTTQRIQDVVLLLRSYRELLAHRHASRIVVVRNADYRWEDQLLVAYAQHIRLPWNYVGRLTYREKIRSTWRHFRPFAKEIYLAARTLRLSLAARFVRHPETDPYRRVAVQLCDSAAKHLNHTQPLLRALEQQHLHGIGVCWNAGPSAARLRKEGLRAVDLEGWVGIIGILDSWVRLCRTLRRARRCARSFLPDGSATDAVLIRSILWQSVGSFLLGEVPHRYRLQLACRKYFATNPPRAARFWTRILPQGVIAYRSLPGDSKPLLFWQPGWPYQVSSPYTRHEVPVDLIFAISEAHRAHLLNEHHPAEKIILTGLPWLDRIRAFQKGHTQRDSQRILGIKSAPELCLLCDTGYILRGYLAPAEQSTLLVSLLELARQNPALHLIVKPHPSHTPGSLEALLQDYRMSNLTIVPRHELPYHALRACDILITKFSTLALEGMVLGVPSIGVLLDHEANFACYQGAMEYVESSPDLAFLILRLLNDPVWRTEWFGRMQTSMADYLHEHAGPLEGDSNRLIAETLAEHLKC